MRTERKEKELNKLLAISPWPRGLAFLTGFPGRHFETLPSNSKLGLQCRFRTQDHVA